MKKQSTEWKAKYVMSYKHVQGIYTFAYIFKKETVNGRINQKLTIKQITTKGRKETTEDQGGF